MPPNPWAVSCLQAAQVAIVADSGFKACSVIANPEGQDLNLQIISTPSCGFAPSWLERLQKFIVDELSENHATISQVIEDKDVEDDVDDVVNEDELLAVAEDEVEQAIDVGADDDPDVRTLELDEEEYEVGTIESELGLTMVVPQDEEEYGTNAVESETGLSTVFLKGSEVLDNEEELPCSSGRWAKRPLILSDSESEVDSDSPQKKKPRIVMDFILIPSLPSKKSDLIGLPFILSVEEISKLAPLPAGAGGSSCETDKYLKHLYNVDLAKVPGRTQKWTGQSGQRVATATVLLDFFINSDIRAWNSVTSLAIPHDHDAIPIANSLIKDDDLSTIGCAFLADYDTIICQNLREGKPCNQGIPLIRLMAHCHGTSSTAHSVPFCKKVNYKYSPQQKAFIHRLLAKYPNIVVTIKELHDLCMHPAQFGPICHLQPPVNGFACTLCDFCILNLCDVLSGGLRGCQVQALNTTTTLWLEVPPLSSSMATPSTSQKPIAAILAEGLAPNPAPYRKLNKHAVLPNLRESGAVDFADRIDPAVAFELVSLPGKSEHALVRRQLAIVRRFQELCKTIVLAPPLLRRLLVKPERGEHCLVDKFNCPTKVKTIKTYALEEVHLLCFIIRCIEGKMYCKAPKSPWEGDSFYLSLTVDQVNSFHALRTLLCQSKPDQDRLSNALASALGSIYTPMNRLDLFVHPYLDPINAYVCLRSLDPKGGFRQPKLLTAIYSKIQFGIRLYLMNQIEKDYVTYTAEPREGDPYDGFICQMRVFLGKWAAKGVVSPLAMLQMAWIRPTCLVACKEPSKVIVMWDSTHSALSVDNHIITIADYKSQVQDTLQTLIKFVDSRVLRNIKLPVDFPEETYDVQTRGYGLFSTSSDELAADNHPSSVFLTELCQTGELCCRIGNEITWDSRALVEWLIDIDHAWSTVLVLVHLLSPPACGTEVVLWQHTNTASSCRHLFLSSNLRTLVTVSNYNKSTAITGLYKHILRVIPHAVSTVIMKLLRIVWPVQTFTVKSQTSTEHQDNVVDIFDTYIFASFGKVWDTQKVSNALKNWFEERLAVPFRLNQHRHFAQAVQRKFLTYDQKDNELEVTANLGLGHGQEAANMNYARQKGDLDLDVTQRMRFETVGSDWIAWHGISVSAPEV
ncbi:hypothetical protein SCLCIDRAFT_32998 [Scleroderma citrinum Foug A]|uniref:Uncharacterized protein n=1 Tax=Scleroderma citrinum Foug A TaxID=1036808 RepID=A0A0C3D6D6_9AGAM|nr:hypothetical protein SCLCIDRAFT_32998 [Scleroderma citrinum Foug A]